MKIELVSPAAEDSARLRSLAMAVLAGLTPESFEVSLKDDILHRLNPGQDLDFNADLAAISLSTKTAARGYELADIYRQHGVKVVLGGIHPTALPEEARQHADAVVVGEAEGLWPRLLRDLEEGTLQEIYRHDSLPDFSRAVRPRREIFTSRAYIPLHTIQSSRGCPFSCEFCSVTPFFGREFRLREVSDVVEEIRGLDGRWLMFADDNILCRPEHSRELFRQLKGQGVKWFGQASLHGLQNPENLKLMAEAGCQALFVGFESVNLESLAGCGKRQNFPARYLEIVQRLHDHGIAIWGSFVLGLDQDTEAIFEQTLEFVLQSKMIMALFAMLTPYPGTPLYQRLKAEGRLLDEQWWLKKNRVDFPLYRPRLMSAERLYRGWQETWREFYSARSILHRLGQAPFTSLFSAISFLPLNLLQRRLTQKKILGGEKFFLRDR